MYISFTRTLNLKNMKRKIVIIGSGLGGLSCGVLLAKEGYDVTILEQSFQPGGCLQCFTRKGIKFETGMHFIGSADKGQTLFRLMKALEIDDKIQLSRLNEDGYDIISLCGKKYKFANGHERFVEQLAKDFPDQKTDLERYWKLIEDVARSSSLHSLDFNGAQGALGMEYQMRAMDEVLNSVITNPYLANVLAGNLPLYAAEKGKTPFSTHAFIMDFYNNSAYRVVGGSDNIARALVSVINKYGGRLYLKKKVTRIICDNEKATAVECCDGSIYNADIVISSVHPMRTVEMLMGNSLIRPVYRKRIESIQQTIGGFAVYLLFKENTVPYLNYNYYAYNQETPWDCEKYTSETWPKGYLYMHFCHTQSPVYAQAGVVLSYMQMKDVEQWIGTRVGHRGEEYEEFKRKHAEKLIEALEKEFPGIKNNIEDYYTSTPLTYFDYTGTEGGAMYGIAKDVSNSAGGRVSHKTKIPNLFLAGQNINSHGILGTIVGTIVTCGEIIPQEKLYQTLSMN